MQIKRTTLFKKQFRQIVFFIAKDKGLASKSFKNELNKNMEELIHFPYMYKPSIYYENKEVRDMTFKGYSIIYRVDELKKIIEIVEIFNKNLTILKEDI